MQFTPDDDRCYPIPENTYWHMKCVTCGHQYCGPKRASECYPCSQLGEQLIFDFASI